MVTKTVEVKANVGKAVPVEASTEGLDTKLPTGGGGGGAGTEEKRMVHGGRGNSIGGVVSVWFAAVTVTVNSSVIVSVTISTGLVNNRNTPEQFEAVILSSIEEVELEEREVMVVL